MNKIKVFIKNNYKSIIALVLFYLVVNYELPFVIYTPGGAINMSERISGDNLYEEDGSLSLTYVSLIRGKLPFLGLSYLIPNWDIVPNEEVTYKDRTVDETIKIDKIYMEEAISNAEYVAYKAAGINYKVSESKTMVTSIFKEAKTSLKVSDEIISVDGIQISSINNLQEYVKTKNIGDIVKITYKRNDKTYSDNASLIDVAGEPKIGISLAFIDKYATDYNIKIETKNSESGPSGGLITALAIYNQITANDITKGYKIMGTGTISKDGTVGEIGGVKYKLIGAVKKGANVFICPQENYEEALKVKTENKYDITLISAKTFNEALAKLNNIKN